MGDNIAAFTQGSLEEAIEPFACCLHHVDCHSMADPRLCNELTSTDKKMLVDPNSESPYFREKLELSVHPNQCPLCDQEQETIQQILTNCVFSRQVWYLLLRLSGSPDLSPWVGGEVSCDWWLWINTLIPGHWKSGVNSLISLGAWMIKRHRNECVFNGAAPSVQVVLRRIF